MSSPRILQVSRNVGVYDFDVAGCVLAKHVHHSEDSHMICVMRGSIILRIWDPKDGTITETTHSAGAIIDTFPGWAHEVEALEDNTRTVHPVKD